MIYTRQDLQELLKHNHCEVTFTKIDGSVRIMPCTLQENAIPARPVETVSKSNEKRLKALDVLSVWCLDKKEWRSFRIANVTDIKVIS